MSRRLVPSLPRWLPLLVGAAALFALVPDAAAGPICRPGTAPVALQSDGAIWGISPCGGGAESIKLRGGQFDMPEARPPAGALPGWASDKWAAGPLELVGTWDAKWDPFHDRVIAADLGSITVHVRLPDAASATQRSFTDLREMAEELPHWGVVTADDAVVELVWPDPARVDSPLYLRKRVRRDADKAALLAVTVELWWRGAKPLSAQLEHVTSTYHDPSGDSGGLLSSLSGPPDVPGVGWYAADTAVHHDAKALTDALEDEDADPADFNLQGVPQWIAADSRYFLLALLPGEGFGEAATARLFAVGNGVIEATVRTAPFTLTAAQGCVPAFVAKRWGGHACEDDRAAIGLVGDLGDPIDPGKLAAAKAAGGDRAAAAERLGHRAMHRVTMRYFAGPKEIESLRNVGVGLEESIDFGWFGAIARPLLFVLKVAHGVTGSWPIAILILTILVKALLWPIMGKSMKSMRKMATLKPELDKIKADLAEEAKKRGEAQPDPAELNRRTFALYQQHGVNPLGGCLPMFLQMPVYIALYRTIYSSVELFNQPLFGWIRDLTRHDPYYVLPIVLALLMLAQQRFAPMTTTTDDAQRKMMMYVMPVVFGLMMMSLPSGLTLYILTNTVLSMIQTFWLQRKEA